MATCRLLIIDELGYVPLSRLLFETFSQPYERGSTIVTSNLPFDEWTSVFGSERLTGALLDRLTHHVHILELNGESYRLRRSGNATPPPNNTNLTALPTTTWRSPSSGSRAATSNGWSAVTVGTVRSSEDIQKKIRIGPLAPQFVERLL